MGARDFAERRSATIGELVQEWLASSDWSALAPNSQRCYRAALARIEPVFGALMPSDWRAAWGQHYLAEQAATPSAANRDLQVLSIVMGRAVRAGLLPSNPVRDVKRLRVVPRDRYVEDREIAAFRAHCDRRLLAYLDLRLATGARQGQLIALRWRDWDQSTERLFVAGAKRGADVEYWGAGVIGALERCAAAFHGGTLATMSADHAVICRAGAGRRGRPSERRRSVGGLGGLPRQLSAERAESASCARTEDAPADVGCRDDGVRGALVAGRLRRRARRVADVRGLPAEGQQREGPAVIEPSGELAADMAVLEAACSREHRELRRAFRALLQRQRSHAPGLPDIVGASATAKALGGLAVYWLEDVPDVVRKASGAVLAKIVLQASESKPVFPRVLRGPH